MLRQVVRGQLGYRSPAYRFAARAYSDATILAREGFATLARLRRLEAAAKANSEPVPVTFTNLDHPMFLRPGTEDIGAAVNNIVRREYGRFDPKVEPQTMVDAGAYIGDTSAYFLSRYTNLRVIALEPNPESFPLAQRNLAPYGDRVELRDEALCAQPGFVRFGGREMGARIGGEGRQARATTVSELVARFPEGRIDILKLDIEGAETELFAGKAETWLPQVSHINCRNARTGEQSSGAFHARGAKLVI
ncbi:MAG: FkbM family methyltransferase [Pseudomonadota bacterium]